MPNLLRQYWKLRQRTWMGEARSHSRRDAISCKCMMETESIERLRRWARDAKGQLNRSLMSNELRSACRTDQRHDESVGSWCTCIVPSFHTNTKAPQFFRCAISLELHLHVRKFVWNFSELFSFPILFFFQFIIAHDPTQQPMEWGNVRCIQTE